MSQKIPFFKAHGTGNDFVIFIENDCPSYISNLDFITNICKRKTGIGADGVIIISEISQTFFKMDYYNSDGTWETFCANGARCVGKFLFEKGLIINEVDFLAGDGEHQLKFDENGEIWIKMKSPKNVTEELSICGFSGKHVDSGAKHFTCEAKELMEDIVQEFGPKIRYAEEFKPHGVNVNFVEKNSDNQIKVITYEKGIEEVMLSCGSGAVASAYHIHEKKTLKSPLKIEVPGGELNLQFNDSWDDVWLGGPAVILFESIVDSNKILPTIS